MEDDVPFDIALSQLTELEQAAIKFAEWRNELEERVQAELACRRDANATSPFDVMMLDSSKGPEASFSSPIPAHIPTIGSEESASARTAVGNPDTQVDPLLLPASNLDREQLQDPRLRSHEEREDEVDGSSQKLMMPPRYTGEDDGLSAEEATLKRKVDAINPDGNDAISVDVLGAVVEGKKAANLPTDSSRAVKRELHRPHCLQVPESYATGSRRSQKPTAKAVVSSLQAGNSRVGADTTTPQTRAKGKAKEQQLLTAKEKETATGSSSTLSEVSAQPKLVPTVVGSWGRVPSIVWTPQSPIQRG
jgi:hypothetical protein